MCVIYVVYLIYLGHESPADVTRRIDWSSCHTRQAVQTWEKDFRDFIILWGLYLICFVVFSPSEFCVEATLRKSEGVEGAGEQ